METLCPTCRGKGSIDDPKITGPISYSGPNGETCPQVSCRSCGGSGWVVATNDRVRVGAEPTEPTTDYQGCRRHEYFTSRCNNEGC